MNRRYREASQGIGQWEIKFSLIFILSFSYLSRDIIDTGLLPLLLFGPLKNFWL